MQSPREQYESPYRYYERTRKPLTCATCSYEITDRQDLTYDLTPAGTFTNVRHTDAVHREMSHSMLDAWLDGNQVCADCEHALLDLMPANMPFRPAHAIPLCATCGARL